MNHLEQFLAAGSGRSDVRLLFTSAGRRVELIRAFQEAAAGLGLTPVVHVADAQRFSAAGCVAQHSHQVPLIDSPDYIPALQEVVRRERIDFLIPLVDPELLKLAEARRDFAALGCAALISTPQVVQTCRNKLATFEFLVAHGIDTPETWPASEVVGRQEHRFPYFLKPRTGSASKGNFVLRNRRDLDLFVSQVEDAIIQEFVDGVEHTLDVYTGFDGRPRCVVPRRRLVVRGGEVVEAVTVRHEGIIAAGVRVAEALQGCVGLITIQLILAPDGRIRVIEVNPRFGGGVPLAIHAGADFPRWLLTEWLGRPLEVAIDQFRAGELMLRYHQSFFLQCPGGEGFSADSGSSGSFPS